MVYLFAVLPKGNLVKKTEEKMIVDKRKELATEIFKYCKNFSNSLKEHFISAGVPEKEIAVDMWMEFPKKFGYFINSKETLERASKMSGSGKSLSEICPLAQITGLTNEYEGKIFDGFLELKSYPANNFPYASLNIRFDGNGRPTNYKIAMNNLELIF